MSNGVAISALPAATTPLAGTELAAIVQSGTTKKVAVSHIGGGSVSGVAGGVAFFDTNTSVTTANPVTNFTWDDGLQILAVTGTIVLGTASANQASTLLLDSAHQLAWDNGAGGVSFVFKDNAGVLQLGDPNVTITGGNLLAAAQIAISSNALTGGFGGQLSLGSSVIIAWNNGSDAVGFYIDNSVSSALTLGVALNNDNTADLGGTAARVRTGYFGTSVVSPLYSVASGAGNSGITTTITTASLVGKTITVKGGIITGFA